MAVWVVRAGEDLSYLPVFLSESVVGIGWPELATSPIGIPRTDLSALMAATYPEASAATLANYTGQVWGFVNTIALGDTVLVPLKSSKTFRVARVMGGAEHRPVLRGLSAVRPIEWLAESVPASVLATDLRNATGSIMTVFRPRAAATERRIAAIVETGADPGADSGGDDRSGAWVFQSNPKRFDLLSELETGGVMTWAVNQHRQEIQPGDRAWFRLTGPRAGVVAVGRVTSLPRPDVGEFGDWAVDVTIEARIEPALLRAESDADAVLGSVTALGGLMGTNLALAADADTRLEELTQDRLIPIAAAESESRLMERKLNLDAARLAERVELDLLEELRALTHVEFEEVCAVYLRALGCENVALNGAASAASLGDGGIDVTGVLSRPGLPEIRLDIQAKRVAGGIGPNVITQLRGSIGPGAYGMVVTTGHFTRTARDEAQRSDRVKIELVDGPTLAHVLAENGIGVKATPIAVPRLDAAGLRARLDAERG